MNEVVPEQGAGGAADTFKLVVAALLVVAGIAGFYLLGAQSAWLRWLAVAAGIALAAVVFATSGSGRDFWHFVQDSRTELRKVVWPTFDETRNTTLIVFALVIMAGLFFWMLDLSLSWVTRHFTGQGG
jgi:preprotein translocase subunit SecE